MSEGCKHGHLLGCSLCDWDKVLAGRKEWKARALAAEAQVEGLEAERDHYRARAEEEMVGRKWFEDDAREWKRVCYAGEASKKVEAETVARIVAMIDFCVARVIPRECAKLSNSAFQVNLMTEAASGTFRGLRTLILEGDWKGAMGEWKQEGGGT